MKMLTILNYAKIGVRNEYENMVKNHSGDLNEAEILDYKEKLENLKKEVEDIERLYNKLLTTGKLEIQRPE